MKITKVDDKTIFTNDINECLLDICKSDVDNPFSLEVLKSNIRVGIESEFYVSVTQERVNEKIDEINGKVDRIVRGLSFYNKQLCYIPNGKEYDKDLAMAYLEKDDTLNSPFGEGFELVSPMLNIKDVAFYYKTSSELIEDVGYSNNDCGLHFHISSPELGKVDMFKLMTFLHAKENLFQGYVDRNSYAKSLEKVFLNTKQDVFNQALSLTSKRYDILELEGDNHLELRVFGGEGAYKNSDDILKRLDEFLKIYRIACIPELEKELYCALVKDNLERGHHQETPISFDDLERMAKELQTTQGCSLAKAFNSMIDEQEKITIVSQGFIDEYDNKYSAGVRTI